MRVSNGRCSAGRGRVRGVYVGVCGVVVVVRHGVIKCGAWWVEVWVWGMGEVCDWGLCTCMCVCM